MSTMSTTTNTNANESSEHNFIEIIATANTMGASNDNGPRQTSRKMSDAQKDHIARVRKLVENGSDIFYSDWKRILIQPRIYGRNCILSPDAFCIKPSAAWVPHLLIQDYHPYCTKCRKPVPTIKFRWVDTPMIMFGVNEHRYLDTVRYTCAICGGSFRGTDLESISLDDTGQCRATFGIYLLPRCAVDEHLYQFVVSSIRVPVQVIQSTLKKLSMQKYLSSVQQYYQMILHNKGVSSRQKARPLDSFVLQGASAQNSQDQSALRRMKLDLRRAESQYEAKKRKATKPIDLCEIDGVGKAKKRKFNEMGISSGQDLLAVHTGRHENPLLYQEACQLFRAREADGILATYCQKISGIMEEGKKTVTDAEANVQRLGDEIAGMETRLSNTTATANVGDTDTNDGGTAAAGEIEVFSSFDDASGYNGRFFSSHYIESILETHFLKQKPGMVHRMSNCGGTILSMDTVYGPASRVAVYVNGKPFRPWKGLTTMMNEHGEVIWFGFIKGGESISEIEEPLRKLKARLDRIEGPDNVKVIYVDNCCQVRNKIQQIFGPNVLVKLDIFHWQQRWNEVIREKKSKRYSVFRALMSRAVLQASTEEFDAAKQALTVKLGRTPTVKQVLAECNTSTPPGPQMRQAVCAIVEYFLLEDARAVIRNATSDTTQPLFFRDARKVRDKLENQLKHIDCLTDPPGVCLHRTLTDGTTCCARGSNKNELCNKKLNKDVLDKNIISVARADRDIWSSIDEWNQKMNVRRRGAEDYHVTNMEALAYVNALAEKAGHDLRFNISLPTVQLDSNIAETFGFDLWCQEIQVGDDDSITQGDGDDNNEYDSDDETDDTTDLDAVHTDVNRIQSLIHAACDSEISRRRSSLQTFHTMTGSNAWLPFTEENDETSKEERRVFATMSPNYNRRARTSSPTSYAAFSKKWDLEAGRRYLAKLGGEDVIPIYCKTAEQLSNYFDKLEEESAAAALATEDGMQRLHEVNRLLKNTRTQITTPQVLAVQPIVFPQALPGGARYTPMGNPLTMNTSAAFPRPVPMNPGATRDGALPFGVPIVRNQTVPVPRPNHANLFRKVCRKCGRAKGDHQRSQTGSMFGPKCGFQHCGRCLLAQPYHAGGKMGVFCTVSANAFPCIQADMLTRYDTHISTLSKP